MPDLLLEAFFLPNMVHLLKYGIYQLIFTITCTVHMYAVTERNEMLLLILTMKSENAEVCAVPSVCTVYLLHVELSTHV